MPRPLFIIFLAVIALVFALLVVYTLHPQSQTPILQAITALCVFLFVATIGYRFFIDGFIKNLALLCGWDDRITRAQVVTSSTSLRVIGFAGLCVSLSLCLLLWKFDVIWHAHALYSDGSGILPATWPMVGFTLLWSAVFYLPLLLLYLCELSSVIACLTKTAWGWQPPPMDV